MNIQYIVTVLTILLFAVMAGCSSNEEEKAKEPNQQMEIKATPAQKVSIDTAARKVLEDIPEQLEYFGKMPFEKALTLLDINHDKIINLHDVETVLQALESKHTDSQMDINQDGAIDRLDANLLSMLAGGGEAFPNGFLDANYDGRIDADDYQLCCSARKIDPLEGQISVQN